MFLPISRWHTGCPLGVLMFSKASPLTSTDAMPIVPTRYLFALAMTVSAVLACAACEHSQAAPAPSPPPEVAVVAAVQRNVPVSSEWIGTLDGSINAQIRPQVTGYLLKRLYREGTVVRKGDVLFEIEVALTHARAQLAEAEAQLGKTELDIQRDTPLAKEHAIAQGQLDNEVQANLASKATVQSAKAGVDTATLNVGFTRVTSLIDGVAAIANAQIGDLVSPTTLLTTVSQVDPIKAYFSISEQEYMGIASRLNAHTPGTPLWERASALQLVLGGDVYRRAGSFLAADRQVDATTGTIRISAVFPNPGNVLRPGQYGHVRANTKTLSNAVLVPQRAVTELQGHSQVQVVGPDNRMHVRPVKVGIRLDTQWVVEDGLQPGERVVVDAASSLPDGALVRPQMLDASNEAK
jgi:membrane fusion protein (multidrug efflux system)